MLGSCIAVIFSHNSFLIEYRNYVGVDLKIYDLKQGQNFVQVISKYVL